MELKIALGKGPGMLDDSPETEKKPVTVEESKKEFPVNSTWKEEAADLLKQAYEICSKGDGELAMEVCDQIQMAMDLVKKEEQEPDEAIEGMKSLKGKDFMSKFQSQPTDDVNQEDD